MGEKMRKAKKIVTTIVAVLLVLTSTFNSSAMEITNQQRSGYSVYENGVKYDIEVTKTNEKYSFLIKADDTKGYSEVIIDKNLKKIEITQIQNGIVKSNDSIDLSQYQNEKIGRNIETRAISYNSKITEKVSKKYWYQYGSENQKTYLQIGCDAKYRIRTDNLSSAKEKKCTAYSNAIKNCNSKYFKAEAAAAGSGVLFGTVLALVTANIAFPPSVIISIVVAAVGGGGSVAVCVNNMIDSFQYYNDAKDLYITIRTYGTKL